MCKSLIALIFFVSIASSASGYPTESLVKLNVLGGSLGTGSGQSSGVELHLEMISVGFGKNFSSGLGVLASTKLTESFGTFALAADPMETESLFPIYVYVTSGLHSRKKLIQPVPYVYGGGSGWTSDDDDYLRLGVGLKWTLFAVSLGGEMSWRGVWIKTRRHGAGYERHCYGKYSLSITLELGGWWAENREESTRKDEILTD
jgi:hypothetical protein